MDNLNWIDEMRQVTQIPNSILKSISTPELIDLIIEYPLLCDIKAYESIYGRISACKREF